MECNKKSHSVYLLTYHIVFVTKYRRPVISDEIGDFMKNHAKYLCGRFDGKVLSMYEDHNRENHTTSQTIKLESGNITSQYYKNRCLAICDNILQMANYDSNLSQFDDKEE